MKIGDIVRHKHAHNYGLGTIIDIKKAKREWNTTYTVIWPGPLSPARVMHGGTNPVGHHSAGGLEIVSENQ